MGKLVFGEKALDFLAYPTKKLDICEGPTGTGKTVNAVTKMYFRVIDSKHRFHFMLAQDLTKAEQNLILEETVGMIDISDGLCEFYKNGHGNISGPHVVVHDAYGGPDKYILIASYADEKQWKKILGGQYGCCFIDEVNQVRDMRIIQQSLARANDYEIWTLNPDNPEAPIYKYINQARPIKKYQFDAPREILSLLRERENKNWKWWFFGFKDNPWLTPERIEQKKSSFVEGTKEYNSYILGIRSKAEDLCFTAFTHKNIISREELHKKVDNNEIKFIKFTAGCDTAFSDTSPDLIAYIFAGITSDKKIYILDEFTHNNTLYRETHNIADLFDSNDVVRQYIKFLTKNAHEWGYTEYAYIDSADAGTRTTIIKYMDEHSCPFDILPVKKSLLNIEGRISKMNGWLNKTEYIVIDDCEQHIHELNVYARDKKTGKPEDGNDHTINASQYSWLVLSECDHLIGLI